MNLFPNHWSFQRTTNMDYSHLQSLSNELILAVMKMLPTFYDLNSLVRTNKFFGLVFESNQYGVCEEIARNQFGDVWDDANNLLQHGQRLCHFIPSSSARIGSTVLHADFSRPLSPIFLPPAPSSSPTNGNKARCPVHSKCCGKPVGRGILAGGTKIGLAEATMLMKFTKRSVVWKELVVQHLFADEPWENVKNGIRISNLSIPDTCSITTQESLRIDRALLRYYLLLVSCAPDWATERSQYHLLFLNYKLFPEPLSPEEAERRASMSHDELIERKRERIAPFLQHRGRDLSDIYVVARATVGCSSQMPGTVEQGADHIYERWSNIDDSCVQQEADIHIKRVWIKLKKDPERLLDDDLFFFQEHEL